MANKFFIEFRCGRTSTSNAERFGRSIGFATPETIIEKIYDTMWTDRRLKMRKSMAVMDISQGSVVSIFHKRLGLRKLPAN